MGVYAHCLRSLLELVMCGAGFEAFFCVSKHALSNRCGTLGVRQVYCKLSLCKLKHGYAARPACGPQIS